jgi:hypothetical protein
MGEMRYVYKILVGNPEEKRSLARKRCRWENNIKVEFEEVGRQNMDWIQLA